MHRFHKRPVIFGEVLFDHFADGSRILGGAPFNVAWHLRGFNSNPLVISAVGDDAEGREILERMTSWDLMTHGVQVDRKHPTGRVTATVVDGENRFEIAPGQAWTRSALSQRWALLSRNRRGSFITARSPFAPRRAGRRFASSEPSPMRLPSSTSTFATRGGPKTRSTGALPTATW